MEHPPRYVSLPSSADLNSSFDSAHQAIVGELNGLLTIDKKRKQPSSRA